MSDVFTRYELDLEQLLARLGPKHSRAAESGEAPVAMAGRVFLAYSHQDEAFAHRRAADLPARRRQARGSIVHFHS